MTFGTDSKYASGFDASDLLYTILFIKFKVPYDEKFRYEEKGYVIERINEEKNKMECRLEEMSATDTKSYIQRYIKLQANWPDRVKRFFSDYELETE